MSPKWCSGRMQMTEINTVVEVHILTVLLNPAIDCQHGSLMAAFHKSLYCLARYFLMSISRPVEAILKTWKSHPVAAHLQMELFSEEANVQLLEVNHCPPLVLLIVRPGKYGTSVSWKVLRWKVPKKPLKSRTFQIINSWVWILIIWESREMS